MKHLFLFWLIGRLVLGSMVYGQASSFRNFSVNEGVAQSQVYTLLQDHQGIMWMGTRGGGISLYDGKKFTQLTEKEGLVNNFVYKIIQDKKNQIWIGTNNGVSLYDGKVFESFKLPVSEGNLMIYDMCMVNSDDVWLGTNQGVFAIIDGKLREMNKFCSFTPENVNAIYQDKSGKIWLGTGKGLHRLVKNGRQWTRTFLGDQHKAMLNAITCLKEDKKGNLYFGTYGDGFYCYTKQNVFRLDLQRELYKTTVFDILFDKDGICWLATLGNGVVQYNPFTKSFTTFNQSQGLSNNHVRCVLQDNSGNMWFGTSGGGVCQFNGSEFSHFTSESGLGANFVYSIYRDSQDRLWIGTGQNGVSCLQDNVFTQFNSSNGFESIKVKSIAEDNFGKLYFGTEGKGIFVYHNDVFQLVKGTEKQYIRQLTRHPDGTIWAATSGTGLLQIDPKLGKVVQQFTYANAGLLQNRLTCLHIDGLGRIWYGAESYGLGIVDPKTKKKWRFTIKDGMPANAIRSIVEGRNGEIWVGTAGSGMVSFEAKEEPKLKKTIGLKDGLFSANIYLMVFAKNDNLIVGTESGLDIIHFNRQGEIKRIKHYGRSDGFLGVETCQNSVFKDADGKMWFGTINGLTCYRPEMASDNKVAPLLSFTDVLLFYESFSKTKYKDLIQEWGFVDKIALPYHQNHLSFLFRGINLRNPEGVEFSWRMQGMEEEWSPWSKEQRIVYSNLNSGRYTFLLRSRNEDGVVTQTPLKVEVEIETPFWRKTWFYVVVLGLAILLLYLLFHWQTKRIKTKAKQAQDQAELAKNLIELEQKALRLQMNPHFIFNALNSIQALIGTENETEARYYLAKFSRLMRQILDNSRKTTISLEEEMASLENYLLIEQFCNGNRFDYEIKMELETEANYLEIPPMMVQPYVENAIKHGFKFQPEDGNRRGKLTIRFLEKEKALLCEIEDNGIGRKKSQERSAKSVEGKHVSTGLNVTQERLDLLMDDKRTNAIEMLDLKDETGQDAGTKVTLTIPFL